VYVYSIGLTISSLWFTCKKVMPLTQQRAQ